MENNWERGYIDGINDNPPQMKENKDYMDGYRKAVEHTNCSGVNSC